MKTPDSNPNPTQSMIVHTDSIEAEKELLLQSARESLPQDIQQFLEEASRYTPHMAQPVLEVTSFCSDDCFNGDAV